MPLKLVDLINIDSKTDKCYNKYLKFHISKELTIKKPKKPPLPTTTWRSMKPIHFGLKTFNRYLVCTFVEDATRDDLV